MVKNLVIAFSVCAIIIAGIGVYEIEQGVATGTTSVGSTEIAIQASAASATQVSCGLDTTATANAKSPTVPCGTALAKSVTGNGYRLDVYLPTSPKAGGNFPILIVIQNVNNTSGSYPYYDLAITDSIGHAMDPILCYETAPNPSLTVGHWTECGTYWNLTQPSRSTGVVPQPGTYHVRVSVPGLVADSDVTLSP